MGQWPSYTKWNCWIEIELIAGFEHTDGWNALMRISLPLVHTKYRFCKFDITNKGLNWRNYCSVSVYNTYDKTSVYFSYIRIIPFVTCKIIVCLNVFCLNFIQLSWYKEIMGGCQIGLNYAKRWGTRRLGAISSCCSSSNKGNG
jgi:hypothetical protein